MATSLVHFTATHIDCSEAGDYEIVRVIFDTVKDDLTQAVGGFPHKVAVWAKDAGFLGQEEG